MESLQKKVSDEENEYLLQAKLIQEDEIEKENQKRLSEEIKLAQQLNGPVPSKTKEDLNNIAHDFYSGKIFSNLHMSEYDVKSCLSMVFMVLAFMDPRDMYIPESIGLIYEYIHKAGPRSINGMPMFFSMNYLNVEDTAYVLNKVQEIKSVVENLLNPNV